MATTSDGNGSVQVPGGPEITRVHYDAGILRISWEASPNPAASFVVVVTSGTLEIAAVEAGRTTNAWFPIDLDPGREYDVAVRIYVGGSHGKLSDPVPVVVRTVAVTSAVSDPVTGQLTLAWPAGADHRFRLRVGVNGAPPDPETAVTGTSVTLPAPAPGATAYATLAREIQYGAAVTIGPTGPGFAIPTARPDLVAADFDGTGLAVGWTAVPEASAYRISVLRDGAMFFRAPDVPAPATAAVVAPGITDLAAAYTVVVQAVLATGSGPASPPLGLVLTAPGATAVTYDGNVVAVTAPPGSYDLAVLREAVPVATAAGLHAALDPHGGAHSLLLRIRSGRTTGPAASLPAILDAPVVTAVFPGPELGGAAAPEGLATLGVSVATGPLPAGTALEAVLYLDGRPGTPQPVGPDGTAYFDLPAGPAGPAAVAARGVDGIATGPWSAPVPALTVAPAPVGARVRGEQVDLAWTAPPDGRFLVQLAQAGTTLAETVVRGGSATLPLHAAGTAAVTAQVTQVAGVATGPAAVVGVIAAPPVPGWEFDPVSGDATVAWAAVPGAASYDVVLRNGTALVAARAVTATQITYPAERFAAGGAYSVAVCGTAGPGVSGPLGAGPLLATAPDRVAVHYDGATVTVRWDAVTATEVSGYRVGAVSGDVVTVLGDTAATAGSWPLVVTDPATTVVVQALAGTDVGAPSVPVALLPQALFPGPGWLAPLTGPALVPHDLELRLPQLFATAPDPSKLADLDPALGFTLTPAEPPYAWVLTIPATSPVWSFDDRSAVVPGWVALVQKLQGPGLGATAAGIYALTEAVSRAMPQTYAETLYFAYGVQFGRGCFDLRPGVVLRAEFESFQFLGGSPSAADLSGYVTSAVADYDVVSYPAAGRWLVGLDAFLGRLASQGVVVPGTTSGGKQYGGGGVLDGFFTTLQAPFARVVYPGTFLPTRSDGSMLPQENAVLLTATTLAALEAATDDVRRRAAPGGGVAALYLRGRAVLRPLVRVTVDGEPRLVPAGTTVGDLLAAAGRRPPAVAVPLTGVRLHRARAAAVTAGAAVTGGPAGEWPVRLDWSAGDPGRLDLPVLHGDRLDLAPDRA